MKNKLFKLIIASFFIFAIASCNNKNNNYQELTNLTNSNYIITDEDTFVVPESNNPNGIKIIYDCNNGFIYNSTTTKDDLILKPSNDPIKIASKFKGWYSDIECNNLFDFNTKINSETTIYAGYDIDYLELTNILSSTISLSAVKIEANFSDSIIGGTSFESIGSGVIIGSNNNYYYCLTNNHVIYKPYKYQYQTYKIIDCYGDEYEGLVLDNDNNYDLALVAFSKINSNGKTNNSLKEIKFSKLMPKKNDTIISFGNPNKVMNTISYGKYLDMVKFNPSQATKDKSNVNFDVITHSSIIEDGSSGSMLLDSNLRLVGINFASKVDENNNYLYSYAIPLTKVVEYIKNYENK